MNDWNVFGVRNAYLVAVLLQQRAQPLVRARQLLAAPRVRLLQPRALRHAALHGLHIEQMLTHRGWLHSLGFATCYLSTRKVWLFRRSWKCTNPREKQSHVSHERSSENRRIVQKIFKKMPFFNGFTCEWISLFILSISSLSLLVFFANAFTSSFREFASLFNISFFSTSNKSWN